LLAIGATIRAAREARGMSQEDLALKSDVDRSYLGRVERGDNNAAILTLQRIADVLNVKLSDLLSKSNL
jgi:transcriptional regulator with XRE-family HTH domain